ncbi:MAG TPA: hypothetical protein VMU39_04210 [Solirubrobacteraceae bacterium]|nr:hypothetical protein [Solirubrobacteraceae bacterium]
MRRPEQLFLLAAACVGLAGCGTRIAQRPPARTLPARTADGLVSVRWTLGRARARSITIRFLEPGCVYSFARTASLQTSQSVTIAVYDHYRPLQPGVVCPAFLRLATATIALREPLGARRILHAPVWHP